jgi:hypothetical protein
MSEKTERQLQIQVTEDGHGNYKAQLPGARIGVANGITDKKKLTKAPFPREEVDGWEWAPWGVGDCLPDTIERKIRKVPMAGIVVKKLVSMMYGNGIAYYRNSDIMDDGTVTRARIPKVEQWLMRNRINSQFLPAQMLDYSKFYVAFCEMMLSRDRSTIATIHHKTATHCRLSKQNQSNFNIEYLLYSPDFAYRNHPTTDRRIPIPLYNWNDPAWMEKLRKFKFAWRSCFPTTGMTYYPTPPWEGLFRDDGWMDVAISVPEIVHAMAKNQIRIAYQINIPESYFEIRHPDWHSLASEKREEIIDDLLNTLETELADTKNAFKTISAVFREDQMSRQSRGKIEIIAIDDKVKKDGWVPSSNAADAQIAQGMGLHPSQLGLAPEGGKMGAGSGSDQRESYNTVITTNTIDQQILLEPLNWAAQYNARRGGDQITDPDWDITFYIDHTMHTTTNNQESGLQPAEGSLQIQPS